VGAGSSLEAAYALVEPIDAGTWRLVADGVVLDAVDVRFEILWRADAGDTRIAAWDHHFDPLPEQQFRAQAFDESADAPAVAAAAGDQLVFRYTGSGSTLSMAYIPNGDGESAGGRIPFIDLP
jgi:hypothetical protein